MSGGNNGHYWMFSSDSVKETPRLRSRAAAEATAAARDGAPASGGDAVHEDARSVGADVAAAEGGEPAGPDDSGPAGADDATALEPCGEAGGAAAVSDSEVMTWDEVGNCLTPFCLPHTTEKPKRTRVHATHAPTPYLVRSGSRRFP